MRVSCIMQGLAARPQRSSERFLRADILAMRAGHCAALELHTPSGQIQQHTMLSKCCCICLHEQSISHCAISCSYSLCCCSTTTSHQHCHEPDHCCRCSAEAATRVSLPAPDVPQYAPCVLGDVSPSLDCANAATKRGPKDAPSRTAAPSISCSAVIASEQGYVQYPACAGLSKARAYSPEQGSSAHACSE